MTDSNTQSGTLAGGAQGRAFELSRCTLVVLNGPIRGRECEIDGDLFRIGKADDNDLVLPDSTVSRAHCEILRDSRGFLVRDLGSTNGTLLDGASIKEAYLKNGAVLSVGQIELRVRSSAERMEVLPSERNNFGDVVGKNVRMRELFGMLERLGPSDATVLIGGETGTGKDVLAHAIHASSPRAPKPFIVVDCGAVVGSLIESELFGHEKGAFTGAHATRQGAFELANGGTLFLDEIGELPLDMQPKLLRALEQRAFRRVGGSKEIRVDIRVVAASKRNLRMEVERGKFREDLYFRLAVIACELPPLRERREDIPIIVDKLVQTLADKGTPPRISSDVMNALVAHDWPGNVRELRNVLERALYMTRAMGKAEMSLETLPFVALSATVANPDALPPFVVGRSYGDTREEWEMLFEKRYVTWLLERHDGNISAAAREAEMDRKYLHKLAKKHGLKDGT